MMLRTVILTVSGLALCQAIFFGMGGGGGGGCCCGCGTPQPASCGCGPPPCPAAPACPVCPPPQPCPAPPQAYCPQVQPVYIGGGGCGGGGCGGGGGGCGGGGGGCGGGGCGGGGGGGCGGGGSGGYSSGGGGGYQAPPVSLPAPAAGYSSPSGGGYSGGGGGGGGGGYSEGRSSGGYSSHSGGYSGGAAAAGATAAQVDEATETGAVGDGASEPPADQVFHSPKEPCGPQTIKYIMLRSRKVPGTDTTELVEEELEQVANPPPHVEATANPLDAQLGEEIAAQEQASQDGEGLDEDESSSGGDFKARGAKTAITDEKCNSKGLRNLVLSNIAANDALASKKAIHESALQSFPDSSVDVICSTTGFTYLVSTTEHCEAQKDGVICFIYKRPL